MGGQKAAQRGPIKAAGGTEKGTGAAAKAKALGQELGVENQGLSRQSMLRIPENTKGKHLCGIQTSNSSPSFTVCL